MPDYAEWETLEEWHIRVRCTAEEVPAIAAAVPKMVAGMTHCYQPDTYHINQITQSPEYQQALRHDRLLKGGDRG